MPRVDIEKIWRTVVFFYPIYDKYGGNSTQILLEDGGKLTDRRKTKTLLAAFARLFAVDLPVLRKKYGELLGRRNFVPLPLHLDFVLVPVRVRRAMSKDQGATGYLVLDKILHYDASPGDGFLCRVAFEGGGELDCLEREGTIRKKVLEGRAVREEHLFFH